MASRRYGRYLSADWRGRPQLDAAKVKAAEKFDGKFVVITNDDTLSAEDVALGYNGACTNPWNPAGFRLPKAQQWESWVWPTSTFRADTAETDRTIRGRDSKDTT